MMAPTMGNEYGDGPTVDTNQLSRGSGLSTAIGTNEPSPLNGPPEIGPTASVDRGSENGPAGKTVS